VGRPEGVKQVPFRLLEPSFLFWAKNPASSTSSLVIFYGSFQVNWLCRVAQRVAVFPPGKSHGTRTLNMILFLEKIVILVT